MSVIFYFFVSTFFLFLLQSYTLTHPCILSLLFSIYIFLYLFMSFLPTFTYFLFPSYIPYLYRPSYFSSFINLFIYYYHVLLMCVRAGKRFQNTAGKSETARCPWSFFLWSSRLPRQQRPS